VRHIERVSVTQLRLHLEPNPRLAAWAAELAAAETACCSFFTFILTAAGSDLMLEVTVPGPHVGVLDALAPRISAAAGISA
jgi:hypothetical protein